MSSASSNILQFIEKNIQVFFQIEKQTFLIKTNYSTKKSKFIKKTQKAMNSKQTLLYVFYVGDYYCVNIKQPYGIKKFHKLPEDFPLCVQEAGDYSKYLWGIQTLIPTWKCLHVESYIRHEDFLCPSTSFVCHAQGTPPGF